MAKDPGAFRTIGELSKELDIAQHILRYWETRFPQLQPLKRAGNRRYYRPDDIALVKRIDKLLNEEGYTIRGVQKILTGKRAEKSAPSAMTSSVLASKPDKAPADLTERLEKMRNHLAEALAD